MQEYGIIDVTVAIMSDIRKFFGMQVVFVFDEYYHAIVNEKIKFDENKRLPPVFELGFAEKAILTSGHRSHEFTQFLQEFFNNKVDIIIKESLVSVTGD